MFICVRHYEGAKILGVSVVQSKTRHPMAGEYVSKALELGNEGVRTQNGPIVAQEHHRDTPKF